jgi:microcin C transport system substrate-binding protein
MMTSKAPTAWSVKQISCCFGVVLLFISAGLQADDRFPPYDNSAEVEAFYKARPERFRWKTIADLPAGLKWQNGADLPEMGDPAAKKGGVFHDQIDSFPATFRFIGPDANGSFRSDQWDYINLNIVQKHLNVEGWVPGLADEWAISEDGREVFFKLNPAACYSDGVDIAVEDFFMLMYVMLSPHIQDPWYNDYYTKEVTAVTKYDDNTFSFSIPERKPDPMWTLFDLQPLPRHFFKEFGDDFPARYQWRKSPTTGAYEIYPDGVKKGRSVTLTRVQTWWAKDRKHFRYRYNPDFIEYRVIGSLDKAWEVFRQGKLDWFAMALPRYWYDKSEIDEFYNGYIERHIFYNNFPRISRGAYINQSKPLLDNQDVRIGIAHAMNFQKVIDVDLRGDAVRMQSTFAGFGTFTHPTIKAREFSIEKARAAFNRAGFTKGGKDGVLINAAGKRLSFTLSVPQGPFVPFALRMKEEALKAGLELNIEAQDMVVLFKNLDQKSHELCMAGWAAQPPYPRFWEYYHSDNAWKVQPDGTKKIVPDTNNVTMTADPEMDKIIDEWRKAETEDVVRDLGYKLQEMVHEKCVALPAWESPAYRFGCWRWVKWPKDGNLKNSQLPLDTHVHWIDEETKAETKEAMSQGKSFGEVTRMFDQYRVK